MKPLSSKTARAVHANVGVEYAYRDRLLALIEEMNSSVLFWVRAAYRANPPVIAQDEAPVKSMKAQLRDLANRWQKKFDDLAPKIADLYVQRMFRSTGSALQSSLKDAGLAVKFQLTPAMRQAFEASLTENVGLIKSIPAEYLQSVEGAVMRGYAAGRDLESIVKNVQKAYPVAKNRAVLIARDQSNKANAVVTKTRQLELGITQAIWLHSAGGKTPRKSHQAASGKPYNVAEGMKIDGDYIFPGELINCRCVSRSVIPGL